MNVDVGAYNDDGEGRMFIGTVEVDRLLVGGPNDGTTIRFREGNEPNGDGSYRVVRVDVIRGMELIGEYRRERLSPKVIVYRWHGESEPAAGW